MLPFMDQQTVIADMERRAREAGTSMRAICIEAGVHPTTFSRWKLSDGNPSPVGATLASLGKLDAALAKAEGSPRGKAA